MNEYENYNETSQKYDQTRKPIGLEIILGSFARASKPLSAQKVLDAGCGTGNYLWALKDSLGELVGLDQNEGMLKMAGNKFREFPGVELRQGSIDSLPFENAVFDGITCNQVLHHLFAGASDAEMHKKMDVLMGEYHRVLGNDSTLILNTSSRLQVREGFWWAELIPEAINKISRRFPPLSLIQEGMENAGFEFVGTYVPTHEVLQGASYLSPQGPLDPEWRAGDSTWSLASTNELSEGLKWLRDMIEKGEMQAFLVEKERRRKEIGQTTFVVARKR